VDTGTVLTVVTALAVGVLAALVPVVTAEVYLVAVVSVVTGPVGMACAAALAVGQTIGKCVLFAGARRGRDWAIERGMHRGPEPRWRRRARRPWDAAAGGWARLRRRSARLRRVCVLTRGWLAVLGRRTTGPRGRLRVWGRRSVLLLDRPWPAAGLLLSSASLGLPPLAATSVAAGLRRTGPALFAGCTLAGRLVRFGLIAWGGIAIVGA
jgi:hypothetical protein